MLVSKEISDMRFLLFESEDGPFERPLFLMFCFSEDEAYGLIDELKDEKGFALAFFVLKDWDSKMIPWESKAVKATPKASELSDFIPSLLKEVEKEEACKTTKRYLVGYSLGGLFALWESLNGRFDGFASVSGSMWYPGLKEFVQSRPIPTPLKDGYFSIGDKETGKPSSPFHQAREKCLDVVSIMEEKGMRVHFDLNEGNHFHEPSKRMTKAIRYLLAKN